VEQEDLKCQHLLASIL